MDSQTLLTIGFVALTAAVLFVTARVGAVAIGVLPSEPGVSDANGDANGARRDTDSGRDTGDAASAAEPVSDSHADADGGVASRITMDDYERIRRHLEKRRPHRSPDDLLPSDDDGS
jgi:hypothetical protein